MAIPNIDDSYPVAPLENLFNLIGDGAEADIAALQAAIATKLQRAFFLWANSAARIAQAGMVNGDSGYQLDTASTYTRVSGAWVRNQKTYIWADATARGAQTGMAEGDLGDQADTEQRWRYSGSAWIDITTGLFPVIPTGVAGTGVTVSASGKVTFAAASSVSLNGCFTSAYENYQIIMNVTSKSTGSNVQMRLRLAGTDATGASDYTSQRTYSNATTVVTARITANAWELEAGTLTTTDIDAKIFAPMLAARTRLNSLAIGSSDTVIYTSSLGGRHLQSTGYDGATFLPTSGDMTGTIRIYGYNNI